MLPTNKVTTSFLKGVLPNKKHSTSTAGSANLRASSNVSYFLKSSSKTTTTMGVVGQKANFNTFNQHKNEAQALQRVVNPEVRINLLDSIINSAPIRSVENANIPGTAQDFMSDFSVDVLTPDILRNLLPSSTWKNYQKALQDPEHHLDIDTADQIANAMKDWALSKGATHFTHWFHPLHGLTSEKHDSFLNFSRVEGKFVVGFSGKELVKGEPDASSFPSGGVRETSQARGYTIWDMTSPPFVKKGTNGASLYIPSLFCSWTGEALDHKIPLLRSEVAISNEFSKLLNTVNGNSAVTSVSSNLGPEQEFFLIDRGYYINRPDLVYGGRTVVGAAPTKTQESEHHYFGVIDQRVLACLQDIEKELWKLGIPVKSRHNEVAPSQFEFAPIFEGASIATDHNLLAMEILKEVAARHGLTALLHEKPFSNVNGSGKHVNWSLDTNSKDNLFDPSSNPHDNLQFLVVLSTILHGLHKHGELLRAAIAVPGNSYRLGANEAPPVIISAYLGNDLDETCRTIMEENAPAHQTKSEIRLGVGNIPPVARDGSDRNRTSPFAFTGNRFEFRAVGSTQNIAFPTTVLNGIMAHSARVINEELASLLSGVTNQSQREKVIRKFVAEKFRKHYAIVFQGNGYSAEWVEEAQRRGLPLLRTAPEAIDVFEKPSNVALFDDLDIFTESEMLSRSNVLTESFFEHMMTEARLLTDIAVTRVIPATNTYIQRLTKSYNQALSVLKDESLFKNQKNNIKDVVSSLDHLQGELERFNHTLHKYENEVKTSGYKTAFKNAYDPVMQGMDKVRAIVDYLETKVDNSLWPIPKYDEIFLTSK